LALVLPFLAFVFVVGVDYSRVYYHAQLLTDAANKGAQFASNADLAERTSYATVEEVVLADLQGLSPTPTVTTEYLSQGLVPTARVTVNYDFHPICQNFGLANTFPIRRTSELRLHPSSELPTDGEE
jgi:Flp pilus assembly protein TadG